MGGKRMREGVREKKIFDLVEQFYEARKGEGGGRGG